MRPFRLIAWASALAVLALGAGSARAAWNNVFQVCCHGCNKAPSSSSYYIAAAPPVVAYAPPTTCCAPPTTCCAPPPPPCPTQVCETHYQQRTYYRAEVNYETRYQTEAVTTMQTSYYWEPVTRYRVSSYYDSCSCSYKQVATPIVEQTLRSRCSPVTSYYQRAYAVPVTTMKPYTVAEPVQSCYWTNVAQSSPPPAVSAPPAAAPAVGTPVPTSPSGAASQEYRQPGNGSGAGVDESRSSPQSNPRVIDKKPFDIYNPMPPASGNLRPGVPPAESPKPTLVRTDKFVSLVRSNVEGQVVRADRNPDAGARLVFERPDHADESRTIIVGNDGRFRLSLSDGHWDVYKQLPDGRKIELAPVNVTADLVSPIKLTSR